MKSAARKRELTTKFIEALKTPAARVTWWDTRITGLGLRMTEKGAKSWVVMARPEGATGAPVRVTLGSYPTLSLADARDLAVKRRGQVRAGETVRTIKAETRRASAERQNRSFETVVATFIAHQRRLGRKAVDEQGRLLAHDAIPTWRGLPVEAIKRQDVSRLVRQIAARAPYAANRNLANLKRLFSWCIGEGLIEVSPADRVEAPAAETSRDRVLNDSELAAVWRALGAMAGPYADMLAVLLLLARRREEVAAMCWSDINLGDATWSVARAATKTNRPDLVPLPGPVLNILEHQSTRDSRGLVFPGRVGTVFSGWSKLKRALDSRVQNGEPWARWTFHDFRRSFATKMAELGVPKHVVEACLSHGGAGAKGIEAVYNRFTYLPERRAALERWADHIIDIDRTSGLTGQVTPRSSSSA